MSLNKKNLDVHLHLPKEFFGLEISVRKKVAEVSARGAITLRIIPTFSDQADSYLPDDKLCLQMKNALEKKKGALHLSDSLSLAFILDQCDKYVKPLSGNLSHDEEEKLLGKVVELLHDWTSMKIVEGQTLVRDIKEKLEEIRTKLTVVKKLSTLSVERYKEKLRLKIAELVKDISLEEERMAKEILYYADKVDVNEELVRLESHIAQFFSSLATKEMSVGKTLDFLIQEMARETNSLGVKSQELEISKLVIEMKSDLEKIREQVQNIE